MNSFILKLICVVLLSLAYPSISKSEVNFLFSESSLNSDPSDWLGLDENQVFHKKLTHKETGHSWVIKVGKGGQLFSIKTQGSGELIAYQRKNLGQWIEEVFQHTLPMPPQKSPTNKVVDGDIHQAGYYTVSDLDNKTQLLPFSVYSPMFSYQFDPAANSVSYITWPQHAHLPRRYAENLVMINQTLTDRGGGVVEIVLEFNKWGGAPHENFSLPWVTLRAGTVPVHIVSNRDGSYREATQNLREENPLKVREGNTGGWIAFVTSNSPDAIGIGIVYGKNPQGLDGKSGFIRWGNNNSKGNFPGTNGTVATVKREVRLGIGETLYYRYFFVLGTLANIQSKANELESKVVLNKVTMTQEKANRLEICQDAGKSLKRTCAKDEKPIFYAFKDFTPNAKPLFLLLNAGTGEYMITDDPYEISFDPTDGSTKYSDLLGWAVPKSMAADSCRYQPLSEAVGSMKSQPKLGQHTAGLYILRTTEAMCA